MSLCRRRLPSTATGCRRRTRRAFERKVPLFGVAVRPNAVALNPLAFEAAQVVVEVRVTSVAHVAQQTQNGLLVHAPPCGPCPRSNCLRPGWPGCERVVEREAVHTPICLAASIMSRGHRVVCYSCKQYVLRWEPNLYDGFVTSGFCALVLGFRRDVDDAGPRTHDATLANRACKRADYDVSSWRKGAFHTRIIEVARRRPKRKSGSLRNAGVDDPTRSAVYSPG